MTGSNKSILLLLLLLAKQHNSKYMKEKKTPEDTPVKALASDAFQRYCNTILRNCVMPFLISNNAIFYFITLFFVLDDIVFALS